MKNKLVSKFAQKKGAIYLAVVIILAILTLVIIGWAVFIKGVPQILFILHQMGIVDLPENENQELTLADFQTHKEMIQNYTESIKDKTEIQITFKGEIHKECKILPGFACPDYKFAAVRKQSFAGLEDKTVSFRIYLEDIPKIGAEDTTQFGDIDFVDEIELKAMIKTKTATVEETGQSANFIKTIKIEKPEENKPEQDTAESRVPINTIEIEIPMLDDKGGFKYDAATNEKLGLMLGVFEYRGFDQKTIHYLLKPAYTYPEETKSGQENIIQNPIQNPLQPAQSTGVTQ